MSKVETKICKVPLVNTDKYLFSEIIKYAIGYFVVDTRFLWPEFGTLTNNLHNVIILIGNGYVEQVLRGGIGSLCNNC